MDLQEINDKRLNGQCFLTLFVMIIISKMINSFFLLAHVTQIWRNLGVFGRSSSVTIIVRQLPPII